MDIKEIFSDKSLKPKARTELLSEMLQQNKIKIDELISFARQAKDPIKATCIEAFEFATKINPFISDKNCWSFVVDSLQSKTPRVKWESARVVANICSNFTKELDTVIVNLLANTEYEGTVVRWSAAMALGELIKLKTKHNKTLIPAVKNIITLEEKNSIKKIYQAALKSVGANQ